MAVRFDAAADRLVITSSPISYQSAYAWAGWFYLTVLPSAGLFSTIFDLNRDASVGEDGLFIDETGKIDLYMLHSDGTDTDTLGSTISLNTWFHVMLVRESATSLKAYFNGVLDATVTKSNAGRTANTRMESGGFSSANTLLFNGRTAYQKAWSTSLDAASAALEYRTIRPRNYGSIYGFWPLFFGASERVADYSGQSHPFTAGGTLTDEDAPPVSWGMGPYTLSHVASGSTTYPLTVSGSLTSAGAIAKRPSKLAVGSMGSSGLLQTRANKLMVGALTMAGSLQDRAAKTLIGTLTSAGALLKQDNKVLGGTLTSSGLLSKQINKIMAGALTSAGAIANIKTVLLTVAGNLTSSGNLIKRANKLASGNLTSSGSLRFSAQKALGGILTASGSLIKRCNKALVGGLTSSGVVAFIKTATLILSGTLTSSGAIAKRVNKIAGGVFAPSGSLIKSIRKFLGGIFSGSGAFNGSGGGPVVVVAGYDIVDETHYPVFFEEDNFSIEFVASDNAIAYIEDDLRIVFTQDSNPLVYAED